MRRDNDDVAGRIGSESLTETFREASLPHPLPGSLNPIEILNTERQATSLNGSEGGEHYAGSSIDVYGHRKYLNAAAEKKKKEREWFKQIVAQAVEDALKSLELVIAFHREKMEWFAEKLREIREQMEHLREIEKVLKEELGYFKANGNFDLDENGEFRNKELERFLQAWEAKTGMKIDRNAPAAYEILLEIRLDAENQVKELEGRESECREKYEYHKTKRDEAELLKDALESGDPVLEQWALEEVGTLGNHMQVQMSYGDTEQSDFAFDLPALDITAAVESENMQATNETITGKEVQPVPITSTPKF